MDKKFLKKLFWDYDVDRLDRLPGMTFAQRIVDLWPIVEDAYHEGIISTEDFLALIDQVAGYVDQVRYCEGVREIVIKKMMKERAAKNSIKPNPE